MDLKEDDSEVVIALCPKAKCVRYCVDGQVQKELEYSALMTVSKHRDVATSVVVMGKGGFAALGNPTSLLEHKFATQKDRDDAFALLATCNRVQKGLVANGVFGYPNPQIILQGAAKEKVEGDELVKQTLVLTTHRLLVYAGTANIEADYPLRVVHLNGGTVSKSGKKAVNLTVDDTKLTWQVRSYVLGSNEASVLPMVMLSLIRLRTSTQIVLMKKLLGLSPTPGGQLGEGRLGGCALSGCCSCHQAQVPKAQRCAEGVHERQDTRADGGGAGNARGGPQAHQGIPLHTELSQSTARAHSARSRTSNIRAQFLTRHTPARHRARRTGMTRSGWRRRRSEERRRPRRERT